MNLGCFPLLVHVEVRIIERVGWFLYREYWEGRSVAGHDQEIPRMRTSPCLSLVLMLVPVSRTADLSGLVNSWTAVVTRSATEGAMKNDKGRGVGAG
jgi:hypothetical protein